MICVDFSEEEIRELYKIVLEHPHWFVRTKALALLMKSFNISTKKVAGLMNVCENTVCNHTKAFLKDRLAYVLVVKFYKPKSRLELCSDLIKKYLKEGNPKTVKQACIEIGQLTNVNLKQTQIRKYLKTIGWSVGANELASRKKMIKKSKV